MVRKIFVVIWCTFLFVVVFSQSPSISGIAPLSGTVGTTVNLTGNNFNTTASGNYVFFGNVRAVVNSATATTLSVTVPIGAGFGPVRVINAATNTGVSSTAFFTPTFSPSKTTLTSSDFAANQDFTTNNNPNAVVFADIDADGKQDMIVANSGSANISVFRNIGSAGAISFASKVDFTTATSPLALISTDIDGDGLIDIVTTNSTANSISVLRNTSSIGAISFAAKVDFATATTPGSITSGDFDGDGLIDVAVANRGSNSISVFRNTGTVGTISFATKVDFTTANNPFSIATGDIDGDGKVEIAVSNRSSNSISVFRNTGSIGTISFAAKVDFATGSDPVSVAIGDLDGDGKLDMMCQNWLPGTASMFRNTSSSGTLSFVSTSRNMFGSGFSLVLADMNGDGKVDAIATHTTTNVMGILVNNSTVNNISLDGAVGLSTGSNPQNMFAGDIDGDGLPDLACANAGANSARIYRSIPAALSQPGNALNFNGTNNYVATNISLRQNTNPNITFEAWVNPAGTTPIFHQQIISTDNFSGSSFRSVFIIGNSNQYGVFVNGSMWSTGVKADFGKWQHIAVVYDGTNDVFFYKNGVLAAKRGAPQNVESTSVNLTIGASGNRANELFKGSIDEVRVWNTSRTATQIQANFLSTINTTTPGLVANYNFDQGIASGINTGITNLPDQTTNANNGTLTNFSLTGTTSNWVESYAMVVPTNPAATAISTSGFTANWTNTAVGVATNYLLDVATDSSFSTFVTGYNGFSMAASSTSQLVTGLAAGSKYFYRIRADKTSVTGQGAIFCSGAVTTGVPAPPGNGLHFDGVNDYIQLNSTSVTSNITSGRVTVEAWINLSSYANLGTIIKNWGSGNNVLGAFHFGMNGTTPNLSIAITQSNNVAVAVTSPNQLALNRWYHVAFSADGTNLSLYENGVLVGSTPYNGTLLTNYPYTFIGAKPNELNSGGTPSGLFPGFFNGRMDELRIWNTGRTQAQLQANALNSISPTSAGLIAYYSYDHGFAGGTNSGMNILYDQTAFANNGTLTNFALTGGTSNWVESYAMVVPVNITASNITSSGFTANWNAPAIGTVANYLLDVSTDSLFTTFVSGYNGLTVSGLSQAITGLNGNTKYFFRIRADKASVTGQGAIFSAISVTTLSALPTINTDPVNASICATTSSKFFIKATSNLSMSYQWQVDNGTGFVNLSDAGFYLGTATDTLFVRNADQTINGFKYRCVVSNVSGATNSNAATLTVFENPVVAAITGASSVCVNASITVSSTTAGGVWAIANPAIATISSVGLVTGVISGNTAISYTVTNSNSCVTQVTAPITVNALPAPTPITGPSTVCQSKSIALTNATAGGVWSSSNTGIATVNSTGNVTGVAAGSVVINYLVTNTNNCSINNAATIAVLSQPAKAPIVKDTLICKGTSFTVNASVPSSATYAWTSSVGGFTSSLASVSISTPAMYRVTITLANSCFYLDSVNLRNTADTAIKAKMLLTSQAYLNENVVAVNITNPAPQSVTWVIPAGAQTVSQTSSNLTLRFAVEGKYQIGFRTTSYNVCTSNDSGIVIISKKDTAVTSRTAVLVREVNVSPNPSTGIFNFVIKLNKPGPFSLKVYSLNGVLVYNKLIPEVAGQTNITQQINVTTSPRDTYIAVIQSADAYEVRTLIKN